MASILSLCTASTTATAPAPPTTTMAAASLSSPDDELPSSSHHEHVVENSSASASAVAVAAPAAVADAEGKESSTANTNSSSNTTSYTTPKRPAGLAAVTPSTQSSSMSSSAAEELIDDDPQQQNQNDISGSDSREEREENEKEIGVAVVVSASNNNDAGGANQFQLGEAMDMEDTRNHKEGSEIADAATTTTASASSSSFGGDVVVINTVKKASIQLGPRVTPAPPNTAVKAEEESSSSSDSPVKPRNLDGENSNCSVNSSGGGGGGVFVGDGGSSNSNSAGSSLSSAPLPAVKQVECPSTPGGMIQQQQRQHTSTSLKNAHFPSPTSFLAAKISPLRSSSARRNEEKKKNLGGAGLTTAGEGVGVAAATSISSSVATSLAASVAAAMMPSREKTPPPSNANMDDQVNLSPGMFLCTPKPIPTHGQDHRGGGGGGGGGSNSLSLSSRPSSLVPGLTPTNFASDFGKGHRKEDSLNAMDASNVFAWLHSPTGQGLFSPTGGLNSLSVTNTPRGMYGFSGPTAAAGNNKAGITPKLAPSTSLSSSSSGNHHGYYVELEAGFDAGVNTPKIPESQRSMICISPLSSKKMGKNKLGTMGGVEGGAPDTPMSINFSEVFASPRLPTPRLSRMGPPAGGEGGSGGVVPVPRMEDSVVTSSDGRQSSPVASALHVAERGINLDDDLSSLLQLAETTTPGGGRSTMAFMSPLLTSSLRRVTAAPPSSLQLPIISGSSIASSGKGGGVNISPPQLAIRSSSSCGLSEGSVSPIKASSLKKKAKKRKLPDATTAMPVGYHGQQQPSPVGYSHPSMAPYHNHHVAPPHPAATDVTANNHRYYHRPAYISQGYVYSGHPAPQQHYAYPENHQPTSKVSASSTTGPSPVKSSQKATPSVQSKHKIKPKIAPVVKKEVKKAQPPPSAAVSTGKRVRKASPKSMGSSSAGVAKKGKSTCSDPADKDRITAAIIAVNKIYGVGSEKERKLKEVTLRGVTQRPSRKWQAQLYYAGKSRYIGVFDSKEKASLAYEIAREVLKTDKDDAGPSNAEETERDVNLARKAAFAGVNELSGK